MEAVNQGLKVTSLEDDDLLQDLVLTVFHATAVTFENTPCIKLIENHRGKGWFVTIAQK